MCILNSPYSGKRPMQLSYSLKKRDKFDRHFELDLPPPTRIDRPRSHVLQRLVLSNRQRALRCQEVWKEQREKAYDVRDKKVRAKYDQQIGSADPLDVPALQKLKHEALCRCQDVINRINRSSGLFMHVLDENRVPGLYFIQVATTGFWISQVVSRPSLEFLDIALSERQTALATFLVYTPWVFSTTIRSTPRLPGAPSFALC